ncbi:similar to Saccharomyces cerevisiae YGR002C SWC4 Component of the Swr1p complex that incorporates Htz1p into chromatin [Maudiozyma barnettii]|uniref:SWR1-complex protein 4 n=1 Tax=Maudiozyma barnettii TaxID=61262 RepID=A0A8H2VK07_9SACH|nr:Swc4p [Kazachstania barnettii]CAB4256724.1 similar to Saccharomyces cerevisiae YGR002C SWC4 Component of the Swr1p complex that incorporates Htz1p into chromatin [Kazachstania barnettii]CAD1785380.1 similar to Saccharomyces cerevisiae YGR002C SWC4 Component of the Swr1p complex that incorporates Htz1p into chromatin [Kazachstania barnettii]
MSSSDIFDVLNIKQKSKSPSNDSSLANTTSSAGGIVTGGSSTLTSRAPKPQVTGMQRELYNLLGENQPSIIVQPTSKFKESLKSVTKSSPWTQARFKANKRLVLRHWVKGSKDLLGEEPQDSSFAKYDQHMSLPEFTKEEYGLFMAEPDRDKKEDEKKDTEKDEKKDAGKNEGKKPSTVKDDKSEEQSKEQEPKIDENKESVDKVLGNTEPKGSDDAEEKKENNNNTNNEKSNEVSGNDKKETENISTTEQANDEPTIADNNDNNETPEDQTPEDQTPEEWTYEEVEYLFGLCRTYDLRWFVICDRYSFNDIKRTIEELKTEFYLVSRKYFQSKNAADPLLASLEYPLEKELERKKYLERLLSRSAAEIAEEEALIIESRKFEMGAKKMLIERESMLRLLDSPNSDKSVAQHLTSQGISQLYSSLLADKARKRKHDATVPENPWMKQQQQFVQQKQQLQQLHERKPDVLTAANLSTNGSSLSSATLAHNIKAPTTSSSTNNINNDGVTNTGSDQSMVPPPQKKTKKQKLEQQTAQKRKTEVAYAEDLLKDFNDEEKKSLGISMHGEKLTPGVFLRSTKISTFKPALQNKVYSVLQELKLPVRPAMPSKAVIEKQEELLKQIVVLTDLKKSLDKLDAEKAVAQ